MQPQGILLYMALVWPCMGPTVRQTTATSASKEMFVCHLRSAV